ncbi:ATP-binding protein [Streptococcus sp. oral taxon 056]|uniref:ATP-binding protein n=1 Tax=Streptococcus sp. oral taxon 056 TaxID=712620 RepID=UPI0003107CAF|nr:ATP-binding protein [Streptococcus sp. oral taxon 056]
MANILEYPVAATYENLMLRKDGYVMAFYRIPAIPITITDDNTKSKHKQNVEKLIKKLSLNKNFELALIPKDFLLEEKMRDFSEALAEDSLEIGLDSLNETVEKLTDEMEIPYQYDWLIGVRLSKNGANRSLQQLVLDKLDSVSKSVAHGFGYEIALKDNWYQTYEEQEASIYQSLRSFRGKRLTDEAMFYYQRMQFLRYIPHFKEEVIANRSKYNVTDTLIRSLAGGFLKLESPYGSSFLSILPVGKTPTIINSFHLGEIAQRFNFPVGLNIKCEFIDSNSIKGTMGRSNIRYLNIMKEAHSTNTTQQNEIILGNQSLKDLMKQVGGNQDLIEFGSYFIVAGSSLTQLRQRRQMILNTFGDMKVEVHEASQDTPYLFQSLLYGRDLDNTTRKWNHLVIGKGFAELMPFTTTFSGNRIGHYIGRVDNKFTRWDSIGEAVRGSRNIVLFNATVGNKEEIEGKQTKNPHFIITGATGEGKSYLGQLIFLLTSMENTKLLYIDPKRAIRKHYEAKINDPEFAKRYPKRKKQIEQFNFVTLDSTDESNKGVLDPIVILAKNDAISTAKNILSYLLNDKDVTLDQETAIGETVDLVVNRRLNGEVVGFNQIIEIMVNSEEKEIASLGRYLASVIKNSILELAFSDGDVQGLSYDKRVTILEVSDLALPKSSQDKQEIKMSDHQRNSIALMFALGAFCTRFGERDQYEDTIELFDEAWILMESVEGRAIIENMKRIGRHYSNILGLITQSVNDAKSEDDATGFGTLFAFNNEVEREEILRHVGLEVNEGNMEWLSNMISGQCLYKDVYGNLNMISVHTVHTDIDTLLKPMKSTVSSNLENKYAS